MISLSAFKPLGVSLGRVVAGKYRLLRVLGVGGTWILVAAHDLRLHELVTIKLVLPAVLGNAQGVARFLTDSRTLMKIGSNYVARVKDVGALESGVPFIVMEYLEGENLSALLERNGAMPIEQAVDFIIQVCDVLAEAHALGIVHGDLKPPNWVCIHTAHGLPVIKVLNFQVSKTAVTVASDITVASAVMGSLAYMSPEQLESPRDVDSRGDIWAVGAVLYELISGKRAFSADSVSGVILRVAACAPEPLGNILDRVPRGLEAVILRCLDKKRRRRYQDVGELARALLPFATKRSRATVERLRRVIQVSRAGGEFPNELASDSLREVSPGLGEGGSVVARAGLSRIKRVAFVAALSLFLAALTLFLVRPSSGPMVGLSGSGSASAAALSTSLARGRLVAHASEVGQAASHQTLAENARSNARSARDGASARPQLAAPGKSASPVEPRVLHSR